MARGSTIVKAPAPRRILVVRPSHLGDVVSALPVFHALRAAAPEAEIGWVVQPEFGSLLAGLPGLDRVFPFGRRRGIGAWVRLRRELREFSADLAVDAQGNLKSAGAMLASGAPRRIGLARVDWRERMGALVVNDAAPPARPGSHAVERMFSLARHAAGALGDDDSELRTDPGLTQAELARGEALARRHLPGNGRPAVIVHLAAPNDVRSWPVSHYRGLAELLLSRGRGVLLLSGPGERPIGVHLREAMGTRPGLRHWVGQHHLRETSAFFAASARRDARLVSCDSGPMHLAAACGMAVVALAGPQDPARTGPWPPTDRDGSPHTVVTSADPPECSPCLSRSCRHREGPVCMSELLPERVGELFD